MMVVIQSSYGILTSTGQVSMVPSLCIVPPFVILRTCFVLNYTSIVQDAGAERASDEVDVVLTIFPWLIRVP